MRAFFKLLEGAMLFYLLYLFVKWYVKGHFGKYWYLFWIYSGIALFMYLDNASYK